MGSNLSKEIPLLGIAHPVEGNTISGTEDAIGALEAKKWPNWPYLVICKNSGQDSFLCKL